MEAGGPILPSPKIFAQLANTARARFGEQTPAQLGSLPRNEPQDLYFRETLQTGGAKASAFAQLSVRGMS